MARDFGGVIVKQAIALAYASPNDYGCILDQLHLIVFYGCPHLCAGKMDMEDQFVRLLQLDTTYYSPGLLRFARTLTDLTVDINEAFYQTGALSHLRVVNVFSKAASIADRVSYLSSKKCHVLSG
ncbi:hypothetical protein ASPBRDRAFT_256565 [Aspergillus brasiliensis CBS 101740]|uniref:Uncharacterized protein n=1 Tax=Aspergillus brasiliensis (strain CBS 101740 / IMI 381727 / IBT 21946) TaxID=767769 RepID=A0A1L9V2G0_ASPBC|nr:hypothetical protein ASPBRDRAFT_256565 [Aspergillus brasiliensis CBS 101740]